MALAAGTKLDGYEVLGLLGAGGMGEVYRVRDPVLKREVAIKVLLALVGQDSDRLRRFQQEAQAAAALNHPNILAVFHFGSFEGSPYLVSELLEGETLRELLLRGPMSMRKAVDAGVQVARGLAAAHEKGIVHRDLKPENLFVTKDGRVKILDFGLAKLTEPKPESDSTGPTMTHSTEPGLVMGTAGYMSPEQVRGKAADHRADIFAFGTVLYEMLAGKRAFERSTSADTMSAILNEEPPGISQIVQATPPGLQRVVHRCLEKNPEQRFQSASDLAFALEAVTDAGSSSGAAVVAPTPRTPRKVILWPTGIVMVLAVAGATYYFLKPKEKIPFGHYSIQKVIDSDQVGLIAISPDGNYLATVIKPVKGAQKLMLHHIPTGSERAILQNESYNYQDITFSPDGSYIYFQIDALDSSRNGERDEYRIPVLGGQATRVAEDVSGGLVSFIDGGQRMCLPREDAAAGTYKILGVRAEGGDEQVLATGKKPFPEETICAQDGKFALTYAFNDGLHRLDFLSGSNQLQPLASQFFLAVDNSHWHWAPDGKGLFVLAWVKGQDGAQVAYLSYPGTHLHEITNDPNEYVRLSLTTDGKTIATTKTDATMSFGQLSLTKVPSLEERSTGTGWRFTWIDTGRIVQETGKRLSTVDLAKNEEILTDSLSGGYEMPSVCGKDSLVATGRAQGATVSNIYKMHLDGSQSTRLTNGLEDFFPECTNDGKWLFYADNRDISDPKIMRQPLQGGAAQTVTPASVWYSLSPDSKLLAADVTVGERDEWQIIAVDSLQKIESFPEPRNYNGYVGPVFSADSKSFYYITDSGGDATVWRQPLDKTIAVEVATFPGKRVTWLRPSPDGKKLGILFYKRTSEAVLLHDDTP